MPLLTSSVLDKHSSPSNGLDSARLGDVLHGLFRDYLAAGGRHEYLLEHSREKCVANHVRTFQWYRSFLPERGRILDWGCQHAPDSCLLKAAFGDRFERHGCDFVPADSYPAFYAFADFTYRPLDDMVRLPYSSGHFDVVIASGVLEHAAMDYESLKEVHRILRPGGLLIATYLPNRLSAEEWWRRIVRRRGFHNRLYGRGDTSRLLKRAGFLPRQVRYQTRLWERLLGRRGSRIFGGLAACLLPVQLFMSSTLCFVASKQLML